MIKLYSHQQLHHVNKKDKAYLYLRSRSHMFWTQTQPNYCNREQNHSHRAEPYSHHSIPEKGNSQSHFESICDMYHCQDCMSHSHCVQLIAWSKLDVAVPECCGELYWMDAAADNQILECIHLHAASQKVCLQVHTQQIQNTHIILAIFTKYHGNNLLLEYWNENVINAKMVHIQETVHNQLYQAWIMC